MIVRIVTGLLLIMIATTAGAQWTVDSRVDSMTDVVTEIAVVTNDAGQTLKIYRNKSGDRSVWATFRLSESAFDQLSPDKLPMLRVDEHEPSDLSRLVRIEEISDGTMNMYDWQPEWFQWLIYHGEDDVTTHGTLCEVMTGSSMIFRYYLATGGYKETTFALDGSREAINEATSIRVESDSCRLTR